MNLPFVKTREDAMPIRDSLFEGVSRQELCFHYGFSEATLTRTINKYFRDETPPGNSKPWKNGNYQIYTDGRVWSRHIFSWMKPYIDIDGYATLGADLDETKVHRLVLRTHVREPFDGEVGRHLNGDVFNNSLSNLSWSTQKQNQYDRIKMGRHHFFSNFERKPSFISTKNYGHELGLSACFRQWRADSHCQLFHGYPLAFHFTFACVYLDQRNWVLDFGSLKPVKQWLQDTFDHKLLVAQDDPELDAILALEDKGLAQVVVVQNTGCEAFARLAFDFVEQWLTIEGHSPRVWLQRVEVREHSANSAIYEPWSIS